MSDKDLEHFNRAIEKARELGEGKSNQEVVQGAMDLLEKAQQSELPEFVKQRLLLLDTLIAMIRDEGWALSGEDAQHVRSALTYFSVPGDAIPDHVPVLGFLDDAIMIELCARELRHEIDAYADFMRIPPARGRPPRVEAGHRWPRRLAGQSSRRAAGAYAPASRARGQLAASAPAMAAAAATVRQAAATPSGWRPGLFKFG